MITPRRLPGFVELDPMQQLQFDEMISKIKSVFLKHGFPPLDTPVLELSEILLAKSGGEIDKEIYRFTKGSTDMCMRYDFTVPLARYVAMNFNQLNFPFKRYQIGKNYRGERPQKGRLREFYQCDADIIGHNTLPLLADAECISLYDECFSTLNLDCVVEVSNRKLFSGLILSLKLEEKTHEILTLLDKLDKIGVDNVLSGLLELSLKKSEAEKLLLFVTIKGSLAEILPKLEKICTHSEFLSGIKELKELDGYLTSMGGNYIYNMAIFRGHDYYTGTVFEAYLMGHREFGALGGGGRFDNLANYYISESLPGVGMSIGLSRLYDLLSSNKILPEPKKSLIKVLILPLGDTLKECLKIAKDLRNRDICTDILIEEKSFKSKMKDAAKRNCPYVLIVGEDEIKQQKFSLRDMQKSEQSSLSLDEIISILK